MRISRFINALIVLVWTIGSLGSVSQPAAAQAGGAETAGNAQFVPGEVVIGLEAGLAPEESAAQASALAEGAGGQVVRQYDNLALLSFSEEVDVAGLAAQLASTPGVRFAEPNYVSQAIEPVVMNVPQPRTDVVIRRAAAGLETDGKAQVAIPVSALQAMRSKRSGRVQATYPNDPYLWWNNGWDWIGASIVWPNTTASPGVCVLDTGVDYTHKDLDATVIKGYDFVNDDAYPMDDYGHGTHVAGIISAERNNAEGISGVSTGKVIAVKVVDGQGNATNFDVAAGIKYCASRADVRVMNLSLGMEDSGALYEAVDEAVNTKGKLVVASAGNEDSDFPGYPAGYAPLPEFENKVLAVAASGYIYVDENDLVYLYNDCRANYSNYGDWVSVAAPGTFITSTTPWDKPFYMNEFGGIDTRYSSMSGTSMAAPFVAAAAARRWGYQPAESNNNVGWDVIHSGDEVTADDSCWPSLMDGKHQLDVAALMDRGAVSADIYDASVGTSLNGAAVQAYQGVTLRGTGIIVPEQTLADPKGIDPTRVYTTYQPQADVLNLPAGDSYKFKVNMVGYTNGSQAAFQHSPFNEVTAGEWTWIGRVGIPPKSSNFDVVLGWWFWNNPYPVQPASSDLDLDVALPETPNVLDPSQPADFIVGMEGDDPDEYLEGDTTGAMTSFPFARLKREGGYVDSVRLENITIRSRKAHGTLLVNPALPYYPGTYTIFVTDFDQTIDHDNNATTPKIPLMGAYFQPHVYVWKDGVVKMYVQMATQAPNSLCNKSVWAAGTITSGKTGAPIFSPDTKCD